MAFSPTVSQSPVSQYERRLASPELPHRVRALHLHSRDPSDEGTVSLAAAAVPHVWDLPALRQRGRGPKKKQRARDEESQGYTLK